MPTTWAVYHLIHVRVPHQHIPKLLITEVPDGEEVTRELLERAGYIFGEFGIPWANHYITELDSNAPSDLIGRARDPQVPRIAWADLVAQASAPVE
jgi:hypothetical protein